MAKICFFINAQKPRTKDLEGELAVEAERLGLRVVGRDEAETVVVLGGDGTILRAVHEFPGRPVLGFNCGGLGYLASVDEKDFVWALEMLAKGRYGISERTMLEVRKDGASFVALNDIVVDREMSGHAAVLDLTVDGKAPTRYMTDGLIVATPTGSTAYSLAAGGPVLMPDSMSFVVTPMIPHALAVRPLVVKDTAKISICSRPRANGRAERLAVYADGERVLALEGDEAIEVAKAGRSARLVELEGYDPYAVLARKLGWPATGGGVR